MLAARLRIAIWRRRFLVAASALSALVLGTLLLIAGWDMSPDERLGIVDFRTSCGWRNQWEFNRATALLHLFQFADAEEAYRRIAKRDPDCAIAYWGIAMSRLQNPLYELPQPADVVVARSALRRAARAPTATPRERAYLAAAAKLYDGAEPDWRSRELAYSRAMGRVVAAYPWDHEADIFYALALNLVAASRAGAEELRARAAELLLQVFAEEPRHPGMVHYLTYCLGHLRYQPRPFDKETSMMTSARRFGLAAFGLAALCGLGIFLIFTADFRQGSSEAGTIGGPFALTASDGTTVTDRSFRGRWMLIYFGYTHCPYICPTTLTAISKTLQKLGPLAAKIEPVFVTIDPERDHPKEVGEFTKEFDSRIIGLTGTPSEIAAVAKEYHVFYRKVPGATPDGYAMEHSSYIYVIGPDGRYVTLLAGGETPQPDAMASRLREVFAQARHPTERTVSGGAGTGFAAYAGDRRP